MRSIRVVEGAAGRRGDLGFDLDGVVDQLHQARHLGVGLDPALVLRAAAGLEDAVGAGRIAPVHLRQIEGDVAAAPERLFEALVGLAHAHGRPLAGEDGGQPPVGVNELEVGRYVHAVGALTAPIPYCADNRSRPPSGDPSRGCENA